MQTEDQIITFETFYDPMLAHIIRTKLEANGISCFLADDGLIGINPLYNQALGGIKIKIFARDLEKCKEIVAEDTSVELKEHFEIDPETHSAVICPYCGSTNVRYGEATKNRFSWLTILVSFLMMVYPFHSRKAWHCFNCLEILNKKNCYLHNSAY